VGTTDANQGFVLIIRVWFEPGEQPPGFRARIIQTTDLEAGERHLAVARSPDAVLSTVQRWLARIVR
jgi:hypothetical protein